MRDKPVLITASFEKGRGSGHLVRCAILAHELRKLGREALLYLPGLGSGRTESEALNIISRTLENIDEIQLVKDEAELQRDWTLVIFDRFSTPVEEFERFSKNSATLGIDEGGPLRRNFDFLLDLLPNLPSLPPPNALRPDLLRLPALRKNAGFSKYSDSTKKIAHKGGGSLPLRPHSPVKLGNVAVYPLCGGEPPQRPQAAVIPLDISQVETPYPCPAAPESPESAEAPLKILVSFGGEDAAKLGITAALSCYAAGLSEVTLIGGALNTAEAEKTVERILAEAAEQTAETGKRTDFIYIPSVKNLRDTLAGYDLIVTHFGLCAFEALAAGVPVILASPTPLHESLARNAGFFSVGRGRRGAARLAKILFTAQKRLNLKFLADIERRCAAAARKYKLDGEIPLAGYVNSLEPKISRVCPLCLEAKTLTARAAVPAAARFSGRTYRRCPNCGTLYMNRNSPPDIQYTEAYFFENYKKQYGKTYLEDFPNLIAAARRRLSVIKTLTGGGQILDIGCAYGAFAAAARDEGFECAGIDGSAAAVSYVRDELQITALEGFFPDDKLIEEIQKRERPQFDVITLWYVIEHFEISAVPRSPRKSVPDTVCEPGGETQNAENELKTAIEKIYDLLKPGGILAFSTPNSSGISGRISLKKFLEKSPADHWTIWDRRSVKKILSRFGFTVKKIVVTGHHPERFPFCRRLKSGTFFYNIIMTLSKIFRLGDTFEVYAKKCPPPPLPIQGALVERADCQAASVNQAGNS